ncbi:MAG: amidohydrolase family protein [Acidimicrobiaceae bacterium]|nr:amidohydrolase family protein [Acidimicrobiia bacterium]MCY4493324.1 amidohydrolase family protein [Acidimicrobiaceae bacterium]
MTLISAQQMLGAQGWVSGGSVTVADGLIAAVGSNAARPDHAYLIPGYIDIQVNGLRDIDLASAEPGRWPTVPRELATHGVTSWLPTLISRPLSEYGPWLDAVGELMSQQSPAASRILGAHLEGPWLGRRPGAHLDIAAGAVDLGWIAQLPDLVKVVTLCPERQGALEAIGALRDRNVVVGLGHTDADHATANAAFDRGARLLTHCFNANPSMHHRAPGIVGAALARDDVVVSIIADGHHVHPDMIRIAMRAKGPDKVVLISDASGWESGSLGSQPVRLVNAAPILDDGTLAGSAVTLDEAVRFVVEHCGVCAEDAVRSASTVPADLLGHPEIGRIARGARADLVALDDQLHVRQVWLAGQPVR